MDQERLIDKIRKCLALSRSSNEHEAASALRQAQALMRKAGLDEADLAGLEASEASTAASVKRSPAAWESMLSATVADAFGCDVLFMSRARSVQKARWSFIGTGNGPEVAIYAFEVLARQLKQARQVFLRSHCQRLRSTASKARRADIFSQAWVSTVSQQVEQLARSVADDNAISTYIRMRYGNSSSLKPRAAQLGRRPAAGDIDAVIAGRAQGKMAQLSQAVSGAAKQAPLALN